MKYGKRMVAFMLSAVMVLTAPFTVFGNSGGGDFPTLTVEEAARRAIRSHTGIANATGDEDVAHYVVRRANDAVFDATTTGQVTNALVGLRNAEMSRALNIRNIAVQRENVEFSVKRFFNTIINMQEDLTMLEASLDMSKRELQIAELRLTLGMVSELDVETAELNIIRLEMNIGFLERGIDRAFRDLNSFMGVYGVNLGQRYDLVLDLYEYTVLPEVNLTAHANRFVDGSVRVEQARIGAELARLSVEHYVINHNPVTGLVLPGPEREEVENDHSRALRTLSDTRQDVREAVLNAYSEIRNAELQIRSQEIELAQLYRQLEVLETMLSLGRVTAVEVENLRLNISRAEISLRQAKNDHTMQVISFNNPNIM